MAAHTTFCIGGPADVFILPRSPREVSQALSCAKAAGVEVHVIGLGSNLLVADEGVRGAVVCIGDAMADIAVSGTRIVAQAGARLSAVAQAALRAGLTGLEFASGIPGALGGAVYMNAGAYDGQMADIVRRISVLRDGESVDLSAGEMGFSYRHSALMECYSIVLEVELELRPGGQAEIAARMRELNARRREKQPLELPSAGSFFKRPQGDYASRLIDAAGLRGLSVGGAQVSQKHAGFIVNTGNATCADVLALRDVVCKRVREAFGVELEMEVRLLGEQGE